MMYFLFLISNKELVPGMVGRSFTYTQHSSESVGHTVALHYDVDNDLDCKFYVLGLHDNYLIASGNKKFIFRIYRNNWRSMDEVNFELQLLAFLNGRSNLASMLVPARSGELSIRIESPEGERMAALFVYAAGCAPEMGIDARDAGLLGRSVAHVHDIADGFSTPFVRKVLDIGYLLDDSLSQIQPFVDDETYSYLGDVQHRIKATMPRLNNEEGVYGVCIGDVNPTNFHIDDARGITLFDFDQCGYGYRAFEIGKFFSSIHAHADRQALRDAFLEAYQQIRPLNEMERRSIPYFEIISMIWVMAIHAVNVDRIGYKYMEQHYWNRRIAPLKDMLAALPDPY